MKQFVTTLPGNIIDCFKGRMIVCHVFAILLTLILVQSGFDWGFYQATHIHDLRRWMFPAVLIGFYLPICLPLLVLFAGTAFRNSKIIRAGWAIVQAEIIGLIVSSGYKALTGRAHPSHIIGQDISHVFHFGFMRGGVFWGWPSSHTTIAFAMAFTVVTLIPKPRWLGFVVISYALYIVVGVAMTIHWFSDFVAGAVIGTLIGVVVGKSFLRKEICQ